MSQIRKVPAVFALILSLVLTLAPAPASAIWPFQHHKAKVRVTSRFVTLASEPVSSVTARFISANGKRKAIVRADKDGKVAVSLAPGKYTLVVKNGSDLVFKAVYVFPAGATDLSAVDPLPGTYEGLSTFPFPPRVVGQGVIVPLAGAIKQHTHTAGEPK